MSEKFDCKSVKNNADGLNVWSVVEVGCGGVPGVISDESETL
jgi:hypothetical protein